MNNREAISTLILEQTAMLSPKARQQFLVQMGFSQFTFDQVASLQSNVCIMQDSKFKNELQTLIQDRKEEILEINSRDHKLDVKKFIQQRKKVRQETIKGQIQDETLKDYKNVQNFKLKGELIKLLLAILGYLVSGFLIFSYLMQNASLVLAETSIPTENPYDPKVRAVGITVLCLLALVWIFFLVWLVKAVKKYSSS